MNTHRDDDAWTRDLASNDASLRDAAVSDLRDMLLRALAKSLSANHRVDDAFLEDVTQEACMKILDNFDGFAGRSKFKTWAVTIAVRTAVSKMRTRDWQNVSLDSLAATSDKAAPGPFDSSQSPDQASSRLNLLNKLQELIHSQLSERQLIAITAELGGMPLPQIAEKLGSNTNSLYKLLHDARKKLRSSLEAAGFTLDDVREAWS